MAVDQTFEDTWTLPGNNAVDGRYHDGAFLAMAATSASPLGTYRDGVLPSAYSSPDYLDLKVIADSPTPGMAVRCYLGQTAISRSSQGPYVSTLRTTGRVDLDASSTTNPRRDLIVAQVLDASIGDADTRTRLWRVTGTPSGTPVLPSVPLGAIPLADVAVAANATQITNANITDLRKAAGIRGAIRLMLPGDSHSDAGIYPGDARYCRTHQQVEVWKADGLWHGTVSVPLTQPTQAASGVLVPGASVRVATLAVADPGYPYKLQTSGSLLVTTATSVTHELVMQINLTDSFLAVGAGNVPNANTVAWGSLSMPTGGQNQGQIMPRSSGVLTGAKNLYFWVKHNAGASDMTIFAGFSYAFQTELVPA